MNASLPTRIARSVAAVFGRRVRPLPAEQVTRIPLLALRKDIWIWPDKVEAAERHARNPVFTGKINFRRSKRPA